MVSVDVKHHVYLLILFRFLLRLLLPLFLLLLLPRFILMGGSTINMKYYTVHDGREHHQQE